MREDVLKVEAKTLATTPVRLVVIAASVLAASGASAQPSNVPPRLCTELATHGPMAELPDEFDVLHFVFRFDAGPGQVQARLLPNRGGELPAAPPTLPADAASKPGLYVGIAPVGERFAYLIRLGDPRLTIAEASSPKGEIRGEVLESRGGTLATRVPFISDGTLVVCDVGPSGTAKLLFAESVGPAPFPARGREFKAGRR